MPKSSLHFEPPKCRLLFNDKRAAKTRHPESPKCRLLLL